MSSLLYEYVDGNYNTDGVESRNSKCDIPADIGIMWILNCLENRITNKIQDVEEKGF